jgi:fructose-1,6-bisphosphatase I
VGEFILSHINIKTVSKGKIYSANEGNARFWDEGTKKYVNYLKEKDPTTDRPYSLRYIGSLVADFHRNLLYGGIFLYPADYKDPDKPKGKLRLLYEASPMAFIAEQAGGMATTGKENIMDIVPTELHQKVPLIIGSKDDVLTYLKFISENT